MSWSLNVSTVAKDKFNEAVDAAEPSGQPSELIKDVVAQAKKQMKENAAFITRPYIVASAGGHVLEEGQGDTWHEGVNVNVVGTNNAPVV